MKILLSPAKLMDLNHERIIKELSEPSFLSKTEQLHEILVKKKPKQLSELMKISPKLADENWEKFQNWKANPSTEESLQAILTFKGEVFRGLDVQSLPDKHNAYLQENVRVLSGYYGLLKPFDIVMMYRLEMGTKMGVGEHKNLHSFWKEEVTQMLNSSLKENEAVLNLASNEYSKAVDKKTLKGNLIQVDFMEEREGKMKKIMTFFKNARGKMTRFCIENNIQNLEDVKSFKEDNYLFNDSLSEENYLVFTR